MKSEKVLLTGRSNDQYREMMEELGELNCYCSGPFRLEREIDPGKKGWVNYIRERTWFEFFYESILATSQEKAERKKEVVDALEHAFRPMICAARRAAYREVDKYEKDGRNEEFVDMRSPHGRNMDDADNQLSLPENRVARSELGKEVAPSEYVRALEDLLGLYCNKVLGLVKPVGEVVCEFRPFQFPAATGSSDGVPHFHITKRPALEFAANNVIVGSVNALAVKKAEASATLKQALSAFKEAWHGAESRCPLPGPAQGSHDGNGLERAKILFPHATLMVANGLEHIENLVCIPDDVGRKHAFRFKDFGKNEWKKFYLEECRKMRGSVVRELYPNYYAPDPKNGGKMVPFYSNDNVDGAIEAAFELSSLSREDGRDPVSFMFAGLNEDAYGRILAGIDRLSNEKKIVQQQRSPEKSSSKPPLPEGIPTPARKVREIEKEKESTTSQSEKERTESPLLISDSDDENSSSEAEFTT